MSADRLMSAEDLARVTGSKTSTKQAEWFRDAFGFNVLRGRDGKLVMTWSTFEALMQKRAGISSANVEPIRPALRPVHTRASK